MTDVRQASRVGTAVFAVASLLGVVAPDPFPLIAALVSLGLFAIGCVAFVIGFLAAVGRSRTEVVDLAGLVFLSGSAPAPLRRELLLALALQVVVALVAAGLRPFTESAFGVLAPMYGLGLMTWWGGRHGEFPPKPDAIE